MGDKNSERKAVAFFVNARVPQDPPKSVLLHALAGRTPPETPVAVKEMTFGPRELGLNGRIPPETPVAMAPHLGSQKESHKGKGVGS
jgi:hypothetical protein